MLTTEEQLRCAVDHVRIELQLYKTEVEPKILRWRPGENGVLRVCLGISPAVYTWVEVEANGNVERIELDEAPDGPLP